MFTMFSHTQLHVDTGHPADAPQEKKEEDFFALEEKFPASNPVHSNGSLMPKPVLPLFIYIFIL